jgi:hypothetical protein
MTEQTKAWLVQGKITCPDVAEMWGRNIGDAEFRLLDHPDNPGSSADFPSKKAAMDWAKAKGIAVVDMTITDILRDFAFYGHTESPLSVAEIERCLSVGITRRDIYAIGCDCAAGYRFGEAWDAFFQSTGKATLTA